METNSKTVTGAVDNSRMTNAELEANFAAQLATGKPFVFNIALPKEGKDGNMYQQLSIAQKKSFGSNTDEIQKMFLGFSNERIVRAWQNGAQHIIADMGIQEGTIMNKLNIHVEQNTKPGYETHGNRVFGNNSSRAGQPITFGGELTYEHTKLVSGTVNDIILPIDSQDVATQTVADAEADPTSLEFDS